MSSRVVSSPDFVIRSPETPTEIKAFVRLNAQVFRSDEDTDLVADHRHRFLTNNPGFRSSQLRGAFLGTTLVGGYILHERTLCLGPARLLTGCIGGVATHPDYRHQGIATALMQDAIDLTQQQQYALLFLHGAPGFYHQFGYIDVLEDTPRHFLNRQDISPERVAEKEGGNQSGGEDSVPHGHPVKPPMGTLLRGRDQSGPYARSAPEPASRTYTVRSATLDDAPALLACYQRHYGSYLGSFAATRTLQRQEHLLRNWREVNETHLVALSPEQELQGYLMLARRSNKLYAYEVATDTWPATLALLHAHSRLLDAEAELPQELWWPLPSTDATFYLLADHLPIRSEMNACPNQGWQARSVHLPTLIQSLLPLWQEYWRQRPGTLNWTGVLEFTIDDYTSLLEVTPSGLRFVEELSSASQRIVVSRQVFTQLIFGFRPIWWAMGQIGQSIPNELITVLSVLFPLGQACVAGSDYF